ncbi:hypothetical protein EB796_002595 [Bugula neritina]|uniref:LysM domain-containing protein n=1 Tax=Bugula neritina TaxID=10212 RepID=A0A7J7KLM5_BUGNE|nr:hypothetical protein EB796_002595 [Bugula neritina]
MLIYNIFILVYLVTHMADEDQGLLLTRQRGYGAAVTTTPYILNFYQTPKSTISHKVQPGDTLNSLAIRYDTSVADIKRYNRLWNNESLAFKDTISIPIYSEQRHSDLSTNNPRIPLSQRLSGEPSPPDSSNGSVPTSDSKNVSTLTSSTSLSVPNGTHADGSQDFFAKFDKSLSLLKKKVEDQTSVCHE